MGVDGCMSVGTTFWLTSFAYAGSEPKNILVTQEY